MKLKLNYFIDVNLVIIFLICGITGMLKIPELNISFDNSTYSTLSFLHDWSGIAGVILLAVHALLHAKWMGRTTRHFFVPVFTTIANFIAKNKTIRSKAFKSVIALLLILVFVQVRSYAWGGHGHVSNASVPQGIDYKAVTLKDGTYAGTANGYMPSLTVEVTIKNGTINSVKVMDHYETPRWFNRVVNVIPNRILNAQSTKVDAVSGCTDSSHGIMAAVENALKKAGK